MQFGRSEPPEFPVLLLSVDSPTSIGVPTFLVKIPETCQPLRRRPLPSGTAHTALKTKRWRASNVEFARSWDGLRRSLLMDDPAPTASESMVVIMCDHAYDAV